MALGLDLLDRTLKTGHVPDLLYPSLLQSGRSELEIIDRDGISERPLDYVKPD